MDLLSDALAMVRLSGAVIFRVDVTGPWCITAASELDQIAGALPPGTNHVIAFHIVRAGECRLRCPPDDWVVARPGDALVLPHGHAHELGDHADNNPIHFKTLLGDRSLLDLRDMQFETGDGPHIELLCGFLGCDQRAFSPLFAGLPKLFISHLNDNASGLVNYAMEEALSKAAGSASLRVRMAELLFLETLREFMRSLPVDATGWLAGLRDPIIGKVLHLMHETPAEDWTVEVLASRAACSRSRLAERFKTVIGETPMHYLTRVRMQYAAHRLAESRCTVAGVADEVGYASSAAFQRAFKRCFGMPPAAWRRETAQQAH